MKIAVTIAPLSQARLEFCNFCLRVRGDGPRREENFHKEETGMHLPPPQALRFSHGRGERETRVTGDELR